MKIRATRKTSQFTCVFSLSALPHYFVIHKDHVHKHDYVHIINLHFKKKITKAVTILRKFMALCCPELM